MLKHCCLLAVLLFVAPALAEETPMPDASAIVPPDFIKLYDDGSLGEIWGKAGAAREEPRFCVRDGKIECVIFGLRQQRLVDNDSFYNFYGFKGLPPPTNMEVLFHAEDDTTPFDTYDIVLQFTGTAK